VTRDLWRLGAAGIVAVLFVVALLLPLRAFAVPVGLVEVCSIEVATGSAPVNLATACATPAAYFVGRFHCPGGTPTFIAGVLDPADWGEGDPMVLPANWTSENCAWYGAGEGVPEGATVTWYGAGPGEGGGGASEVHLLPFYMSFEEAGQVSAAILALWFAAAGWRWLYRVLWGSSAPESE
jgi:hypothetical protein